MAEVLEEVEEEEEEGGLLLTQVEVLVTGVRGSPLLKGSMEWG